MGSKDQTLVIRLSFQGFYSLSQLRQYHLYVVVAIVVFMRLGLFVYSWLVAILLPLPPELEFTGIYYHALLQLGFAPPPLLSFPSLSLSSSSPFYARE